MKTRKIPMRMVRGVRGIAAQEGTDPGRAQSNRRNQPGCDRQEARPRRVYLSPARMPEKGAQKQADRPFFRYGYPGRRVRGPGTGAGRIAAADEGAGFTLTNRFLTNLGLARRAGKVARGREETLEQLRAGALAGVFVASDVSTRSRRDIAAACAQNGKEYVPLPFTMEQLGKRWARGRRRFSGFRTAD